MHKSLLSLAAATVVMSTAALLPTRADAMTVGTAAAVEAAMAGVGLVEDARYVCRHRFYTSGRRCFWRPTTVCRHVYYSSRRVCRYR